MSVEWGEKREVIVSIFQIPVLFYLIFMLGASGGSVIKHSMLIDASEPSIVSIGSGLKPKISDSQAIPWKTGLPDYRQSNTCQIKWIDYKSGWKQANCGDIAGTITLVYNTQLNKYISVQSSNYVGFMDKKIYIIKSGYGIESDRDKVFYINRFDQDVQYYPHPEIIELNLNNNTFRMMSFYAWVSYGKDGFQCGINSSQSWVRVVDSSYHEPNIISIGPPSLANKCNMNFSFSITSLSGEYR